MIIWMAFMALLYGMPSEVSADSGHEEVSKDTLFIQVLDYDELKPLLHQDDDTTYIVNFWATWCLPCVKELPYFVQLDSVYANKPVKLLLVSLDFKKDYLRKLQPFVVERNLEEYVVVLEDNRTDFWISDVYPDWSGALPSTLIFNGKQRNFYERTFHDVEELTEIVNPFLNL